MAVAKLWAQKLETGKVDNFNLVPAKLQDQVLAILTEDGYEVLPDGRVVKKED